MKPGFHQLQIFQHVRLIGVGWCDGITLNDFERPVTTRVQTFGNVLLPFFGRQT